MKEHGIWGELEKINNGKGLHDVDKSVTINFGITDREGFSQYDDQSIHRLKDWLSIIH